LNLCFTHNDGHLGPIRAFLDGESDGLLSLLFDELPDFRAQDVGAVRVKAHGLRKDVQHHALAEAADLRGNGLEELRVRLRGDLEARISG